MLPKHLGCFSTFEKLKNTRLVHGSCFFMLFESLATFRVFQHSILHGKPFGISLPMYADQLNVVDDIHFQCFMLSLDALET